MPIGRAIRQECRPRDRGALGWIEVGRRPRSGIAADTTDRIPSYV